MSISTGTYAIYKVPDNGTYLKDLSLLLYVKH